MKLMSSKVLKYSTPRLTYHLWNLKTSNVVAFKSVALQSWSLKKCSLQQFKFSKVEDFKNVVFKHWSIQKLLPSKVKDLKICSIEKNVDFKSRWLQNIVVLRIVVC